MVPCKSGQGTKLSTDAGASPDVSVLHPLPFLHPHLSFSRLLFSVPSPHVSLRMTVKRGGWVQPSGTIPKASCSQVYGAPL